MDGTSMPSQWIEVCGVEDIPLRGARVVRFHGAEVGVFRTSAGDIHAIANRCPHKQGPLSEGIVHDGAVTCPLHNFVIDLKSGQARGADEGCVAVYPVEIRNHDRVHIKLPAG